MPMTRRALLASALAGPVAAKPAKPSVVVFVADDLGYGETGFQGNREIPTPHIDSIAANGVRFTQGYVTAPFCCPSRAGLMTGRYQTRFGHELNAIGLRNNDPNIGLPLTEKTIADHLKASGYRTACIGKWHLGGSAKFHPQRRGFDEFFGFLFEGHYYVPPPYRGVESHLRNPEPPYDEGNPIRRGSDPVEESAYLTDALTREALRFVASARRDPFFLYMPYNAVHSPMQAALRDTKRLARIGDLHRRVFAGLLSSMDNSIGAILKKVPDDTLVFFLSDNGGPTAELTSSNKPLRGFKGQLYEGGIRVPFSMQWKGRVPRGQTFTKPVSALDILPTCAAASGGPVPAGLDGVNLLPFVQGQVSSDPHANLFWRMGPNIAYRDGPMKLMRQVARGKQDAPFELFDLDADPAEARDLAGDRPAEVARLKSAMGRINAEMVPPLW